MHRKLADMSTSTLQMIEKSPRSRSLVMALPAFAWVGYQAVLLVLFYFGPIYWPIERSWPLLTFLFCANLMFLIGYAMAMLAPARAGHSGLPESYFKIGALLVILLFGPNLYVYTGKAPTELGSAIADQGTAWAEMQDHIAETSGKRTGFAALRSLLGPFTIAVIPLLFLLWKDLGIRWRAIGVLALLCAVGFSLARGTDKETVEIGLFFLLSVSLLWLKSKGSWHRKASQLLIASVAGVVAISVVLGLFVTRKSARLGEVELYCQSITGECSNYDNPIISWLPYESRGPASIIVNYLTQGYYGLSLALEKPFESTLGLGHSSFLLTQYERVAGEDKFMNRAYVVKIDTEDGWPAQILLVDAYIWLANDFGFTGTVMLMLLFGLFAGIAWRDYIYANNLSAFLVIVLFVLFLFYLPMNLQLTQSIDYYIPTIVWILGWMLTRSVHNPVALSSKACALALRRSC